MYTFDVVKATDECIAWTRDWFKCNGDGCNAVVGISGGKDSSVVAALCVKALGASRVLGVLMPNGEQSDISDSWSLVNHLGIPSVVINIKDTVDAVLRNTKNAAHKLGTEITRQTLENIPPRIRMCQLYAMAQSVNGRVSNNCNLSESWVGYSTLYGDMAGDFSQLANFTAGEVCQIGRLLGLPKHLTDKAPADGLCGKTDEDKLQFTYDVLDRYLRTGEISSEEDKMRIDRLHTINSFKRSSIKTFKWSGFMLAV